MFGFIFTRHINSIETNEYWKECIRCIRKNYQNNIIIIIDDNSSLEYVTNDNVDLKNCFIIQSEYPKRGEILAYYYFYKYKLFDKAVIIHDSIFLQQDISQEINDVSNVKFLWHFKNKQDDHLVKEMFYINHLKNDAINPNENLTTLTNIYLEREKWLGCFGIMSVITHDFLNILVEKYNIFTLLTVVKTREDRCSLERIFAILCYVNNNYFTDNSPSIFGEIVDYKFLGMPFHYNYHNYLIDKKTFDVAKFSKIIKVWCGR
jgi:hypothetical protein